MKHLFVITFAAVTLAWALSLYPVQAASEQACWGQATSVFAATGEMGEHASQEPTPRAGLKNLAVALYEAGVIEDDTMQALGAFVATEYELEIDACMTE